MWVPHTRMPKPALSAKHDALTVGLRCKHEQPGCASDNLHPKPRTPTLQCHATEERRLMHAENAVNLNFCILCIDLCTTQLQLTYEP